MYLKLKCTRKLLNIGIYVKMLASNCSYTHTQKHSHILTHLYIYIYIYKYICVCVCVCFVKWNLRCISYRGDILSGNYYFEQGDREGVNYTLSLTRNLCEITMRDYSDLFVLQKGFFCYQHDLHLR